MTNYRSNNIILVPGCLLCPIFQVAHNEKDYSWRSELMSFLTESGIAVIQMQCPESSFMGYSNGLQRKAHGIRYYERLSGFKKHCDIIALNIVEQIQAFQNEGYQIKAIIGIENSPTCAVNRIFTYGVGTEHRQGLFVEALSKRLDEQQISIPYVGINRRKKDQQDTISFLKKLIDTNG